jgi:hypothetical protein
MLLSDNLFPLAKLGSPKVLNTPAAKVVVLIKSRLVELLEIFFRFSFYSSSMQTK